MVIRIGSRGSALALWQAGHIRQHLMAAHPGLDVVIDVIQTTGDRITDVALSKIGDKGLFTKELDAAVMYERVDVAVHSLKDVPTNVDTELTLAAITKREAANDALVVAPGVAGTLRALPQGARVGTSSLRRRAQLLSRRPDIQVEDLRGNLDTRLAAARAHKFDAVILALAGMNRLGRAAEASEVLSLDEWLPAVGQGALAIVCRRADDETRQKLSVLHDYDTHDAVSAERALLRELEGGCQIPVAAYAIVNGKRLQLHALVASLDGQRVVRGSCSGSSSNSESIGVELARELVSQGADEILKEVRTTLTDSTPIPSAP